MTLGILPHSVFPAFTSEKEQLHLIEYVVLANGKDTAALSLLWFSNTASQEFISLLQWLPAADLRISYSKKINVGFSCYQIFCSSFFPTHQGRASPTLHAGDLHKGPSACSLLTYPVLDQQPPTSSPRIAADFPEASACHVQCISCSSRLQLTALPVSAQTLIFHPLLFVFNSSLSAPAPLCCSAQKCRQGRFKHSSTHASPTHS